MCPDREINPETSMYETLLQQTEPPLSSPSPLSPPHRYAHLVQLYLFKSLFFSNLTAFAPLNEISALYFYLAVLSYILLQ